MSFIAKAIVLTALTAALLMTARFSLAQEESNGRKTYLTYCSGCHGNTGKGDGPAAKALPNKPADHTNSIVMNRYSDEYLFKVISKGGSDVGKSPTMPAWGGVLTDDKIREIIVYLRKLAPATPSNSRR